MPTCWEDKLLEAGELLCSAAALDLIRRPALAQGDLVEVVAPQVHRATAVIALEQRAVRQTAVHLQAAYKAALVLPLLYGTQHTESGVVAAGLIAMRLVSRERPMVVARVLQT